MEKGFSSPTRSVDTSTLNLKFRKADMISKRSFWFLDEEMWEDGHPFAERNWVRFSALLIICYYSFDIGLGFEVFFLPSSMIQEDNALMDGHSFE